jgi:hypothetical protein
MIEQEGKMSIHGISLSGEKWGSKLDQHDTVDIQHMVPKALLDQGVYNEDTDFVNAQGIQPTFWSPNNSWTWGPCIPPITHIDEWQDLRNTTSSPNMDNTEDFEYVRTFFQKPPSSVHKTPEQVRAEFASQKQRLQRSGGCRPGFLIIGAGKCGTSSLYHYLVGHPRVLPAFEKQIHYFKYYLTKPLGWYYSFFPRPQSFLKHGGLMTGEASPGYLPYPQVVKDTYRLMKDPHSFELPKIIMIGREPLDRMYSSYRYNYVYPTLEYFKKGKHHDIPSNLTDDEYQQNHLFSLEDFVRTELAQLKECLTWADKEKEVHNGFGALQTYNKWKKQKQFLDQLNKRNKRSKNISAAALAPLIDLDGVCYGGHVNDTVFRRQWEELQMQNPHKVIVDKDLHLSQAMIGRGLYTFPLEWWYILFDPNNIHFVCTEELSNPKTLHDLALNLGLPSYNFSEVVSEGAYNVGGHRGYDKATPWEEVKLKEPNTKSKEAANARTGNPIESSVNIDSASSTNGIPISENLYRELQEFVKPFNERLFDLTGKRCNW